MANIAIRLDPSKLENPDLDLRYIIPDTMEAIIGDSIYNDGYDYLSDTQHSIVVFLQSSDLDHDLQKVLEILEVEEFLGNNLFKTGIVAADDGDGYRIVHPKDSEDDFIQWISE